MKKLSLALLSFCIAVLFTACKDQEQTVLNLEELPFSTTITGSLTYDAGYTETSGTFVINDKAPVVGKKVFAKVDYSQYGGNNGAKIYETTTNEVGAYTFTLPTTTDGIVVTINPEPFIAEYAELLEEGGEKSLKKINKMYKMNTPISFGASETLPNMSFVKENAEEYDGTPVDATTEFKHKVIVKGIVKVEGEKEDGTQEFKGRNNLKVKVYFTRKAGQSEDDAVVVTTGMTSNVKGEYAIELPIDSLQNTFYIHAQALPFSDEFADYTPGEEEPVITTGIYSDDTGVSTTFKPAGFSGRTVEMSDIYVYFE